jgi:hypothetical protein
MKNPKVPFLVSTLSVRVEQPTYARLLAAARNQRRQLSDYVRLLLESIERECAAEIGK